ncbi:MAG: hypothetical protein ACOH2M_19885 [Cypionkella sp.]
MTLALRLATPLLVLSLAACATANPTYVATAPVVAAPVYVAPVGPSPAQTQQTAMLATGISNGFVAPGALALMTARDSSEANSAQYRALQSGRPGAPIQWAGDTGTTGKVEVGPYVKVNSLDCRNFTHTVKAKGQDFVTKGMACREVAGNWTVVAGAA